VPASTFLRARDSGVNGATLDLQPQPKCLDGVDQFADGGRPVEITPPGPLAVAMNAWSTFVPSV
jgi:hypothetical protein